MSDFEKLINASDLIEWIMETYPDWCVGDVRSIVDHVEALPPAQPEWEIRFNDGDHVWINGEQYISLQRFREMAKDAQEIIRCKDCKFAHMTYDGECKYCDIWFPDEKTYMDGDYFCASAERREE